MVDLPKIAFIIGAIILLLRLRIPLSVTMISSAVALGFIFRLPFVRILEGIGKAVFNIENLKLVGILELVLLFSAILKESGSMGRAVTALSRVFRDVRITVALIPTVIGLLPAVGGAMLSAPLVAEASNMLRLSPERRTFLNYWFRHVWEYSLPTFSTIFLTASIVDMSILDLVIINLPLTAASILCGILFGFKDVETFKLEKDAKTKDNLWTHYWIFLWNLMPFFVVIALTLCFKIHLLYSLAMVTPCVIILYRLNIRALARLARQHLSIELACLILGIMIFKEILLASGAMNRVAAELALMGMPPVLMLCLLPAIIAFITGYTTAFIGLSFPVLMPFIHAGGFGAHYVMLALASGICAHLLSPMHACLAMTLQYYRASMEKTYRLLLVPAVITFLTGVVVFGARKYFLE